MLVPFLFVNTVIYIIKSIGITDKSIMQHPVVLSLSAFIDSTLFHPLGFMWFLPALFIIFIMIFPWWKLIKKSTFGKKGILINILLAMVIVTFIYEWLPNVTFMQISSSLYYIRYFLVGILYCEFKPVVDSFFYKFKYIIIPVFFLMSVLLLSEGMAAALSGIIFSLGLALILSNRCKDQIVQLSIYCYTVFLLSYFPQMLIRGPIAHRFSDVNQYWFSVLSFLLGLFVPIIIAMVYTKLRHKYRILDRLGFLIGL